jgi:hypothetical protein
LLWLMGWQVHTIMPCFFPLRWESHKLCENSFFFLTALGLLLPRQVLLLLEPLCQLTNIFAWATLDLQSFSAFCIAWDDRCHLLVEMASHELLTLVGFHLDPPDLSLPSS